MLTLNQTVDLLTKLGESHKQIETVYFGDVWEFLAQKDNKYPAMFINLSNSNISGKDMTYSFSLFFLDRQLQDESDETDVLSDQLQIAQDIWAMINYPKFEWRVGEDASIDYFTENENDYLAGVKMDIQLSYGILTDRCQVPADFEYPDDDTSSSGGGLLPNYPTNITMTNIGTEGLATYNPDTKVINVPEYAPKFGWIQLCHGYSLLTPLLETEPLAIYQYDYDNATTYYREITDTSDKFWGSYVSGVFSNLIHEKKITI